MKRVTRKQLIDEVHRLDPKLSAGDDAFKCAVILFTAVLVTGPSIKKVTRFSKYPEVLVRRFANNLRSNGMWGHRYIHISEWDDKKAGAIAFWLDVSIGLGFIRREFK